MNADAFRHFYNYHFAENRKLWDYVTQLSPEQFSQNVNYSHGSVRDQVVHLMNVEDAWFTPLRGSEIPEYVNSGNGDDRDAIRANWDKVEQSIRDYLAMLRDDVLLEKPFAEGEDKDLILWQVLIHVVNHGTDHRAQLLRVLSDLGVKTIYQDYVFYAYGNP
jgi:uncharacterized damage-inducible protein DinB